MDREEGKRKLTKPLEVLGRYKYALLVVLLGALLLLWPGGRGAPEGTDSGPRQISAGSMSLEETERAMEASRGTF